MKISILLNNNEIEMNLEVKYDENGFITDYEANSYHNSYETLHLFRNIDDDTFFAFVYECCNVPTNCWYTINDIFDVGSKMAIYVEPLLIESKDMNNGYVEKYDDYSYTVVEYQNDDSVRTYRYYHYDNIDKVINEFNKY